MTEQAKRASQDPEASPVKFLFDVEFDGTGTRLSAEARAAVTAAETEAYRRGYAAGESEANARIERRLSSALAQTGERLAELTAGFAALEQRLETEAVEVAFAVARKLAPALIAREPTAEIEALVADVLTHVRSTPHLVVRLSEDLLGPASELLKALAEERGFAGRLVFLPAPELAPEEARIEWADGGVERDRNRIDARIAEAVENYLARGGKTESVLPENES